MNANMTVDNMKGQEMFGSIAIGAPGVPQGAAPEYTGGSVSYYQVQVSNPTSGGVPYTAECNDIIEALGMTYAEGNAFKALWRRCAARTLGLAKKGYSDGLYDAEKVVFFGQRLVSIETQMKEHVTLMSKSV